MTMLDADHDRPLLADKSSSVTVKEVGTPGKYRM